MIWLPLLTALAGAGIGAGAVVNIAFAERRARVEAQRHARQWKALFEEQIRHSERLANALSGHVSWDGSPYSYCTVDSLIGQTVEETP